MSAASTAAEALEASYLRAAALQHHQRSDEAETLCRDILRLQPNHAMTYHLLGVLAVQRNDAAAAVAHVEQALAIAPQTPLFLRTRAEIARRLHEHERALSLIEAAIALAPDDHVAHTTQGLILRDLHRLDDALVAQQRAMEARPDYAEAHLERAELLLLQGRFAEAWDDYEWRFRISGTPALTPPAPLPPWDGRKLDGGLLLISDQGFGDALQFARYIPWAQARCTQLHLACAAELVSLMAASFPDVKCFTRWQGTLDCVATATLASLPRLRGTTLATIPAEVPYLRTDPAQVAAWRRRLDAVTPPGHRRIGIAWAGRPGHPNNFNRSAPAELFAGLAAQDVVLVSLQKGPAAAGRAALGACKLVELGAALEDFDATSALLPCLDLVAAVDTSLVHLAGALGCPVWVALPYAPDWRWLHDRSDSPWYPTARLFRQARPGDWGSVAVAMNDAFAASLAA